MCKCVTVGRRKRREKQGYPHAQQSPGFFIYFANFWYFLINTIELVEVRENPKKGKQLSLIPAREGRSECSSSGSHRVLTYTLIL